MAKSPIAMAPIDVRGIQIECHSGIDILKSLYAAADKLPICPLLGVVTGAIQEIQALRDDVTLDLKSS